MVSLYLVEDGWLHLQHQVGYHQVLDRIPLERGVMGRVARTGTPVLLEDGRADPDFLAAFEGIISEVCVPLRDDGRVVGLLNLETAGGMRLEEADLRLMLALSEHVNVAIGRARLYADLSASEGPASAHWSSTPPTSSPFWMLEAGAAT
jgi:GAF domain-containing protein